MKWRLRVIVLLASALLSSQVMAQDASGGAGGAGGSGGDATGGMSGGDASGAAAGTGGLPDNSGAQTGNGGATGNGGGSSIPAGGSQNGNGNQNGNGTITPPGDGSLFGPPAGTEGTEGTGGGMEGNGGIETVVPPPVPEQPAGTVAPVPGATPAPTPAGATAPYGTQGALQTPPVTLTLPGAYGGASQSFTLGQGRLAKPPITFTFNTSQGYDDNIFSATANPTPTPKPVPGPTPPLEERLLYFNITPPFPPTPVFQTFRPKATPTPSVATQKPLGVIGSAVSTVAVGMQVQNGSPRTVITGDLSVAAQEYWNQPGTKTDYTGNMDMAFLHRLSPRMSISITAFGVYQQTPDFALINAPTNNGNGGNYLNGSAKIDLSYTWNPRFSTVTSYDLGVNIEENNAAQDVWTNTIGTQFRYVISGRNTITAELRASEADYSQNSSANETDVLYLVGLDTIFSSRLRNTISGGMDAEFNSSGPAQTLPYVESATTLAMARGALLQWTNRYGSEPTGTVDTTTVAYRTGLAYSQPLSTKIVLSASVAYNDVKTTDSAVSSGSYTQNQLQTSLSLTYSVSPRFSLSLSYTYIDLMTTQVNTSYTRDQVFLGGTYIFR